MSVKVKGNMYCRECGKKVLAQKTGHGVRNSVGAAMTLGLSLKAEDWSCPTCGSKCIPYSMHVASERRKARRTQSR